MRRALRRLWRKKRNAEELEKMKDIEKTMTNKKKKQKNKKEEGADCSELNTEHLNIDILNHQEGSNVRK